MPSDTEETTYTVPETANLLHLHPETVRDWIKQGKIKAKKKPGRSGHEYLIPASEIQRLLED